MRRVVLFALLAAAVAVAFTPSAGAARGAMLGIQDDAWIAHGPGTIDQRLDQIRDLGVRVVRYNLIWSAAAPTKPRSARNPADAAYDWGTADAVLAGLNAR